MSQQAERTGIISHKKLDYKVRYSITLRDSSNEDIHDINTLLMAYKSFPL